MLSIIALRIEMKQELGREKDLKDIALIKDSKMKKVIDS